MNQIIVVALARTSVASPSQWEGRTLCGEEFHVRWRNGSFYVEAGESLRMTLRMSSERSWESDELSTDDMMAWLRPWGGVCAAAIIELGGSWQHGSPIYTMQFFKRR